MSGTTLTTYAAGQKLLASQLQNGQSIVARKTTPETVNNSTTLQNDDDIVFTVPATSVFAMDLYLHYNSGTAPDFKFQWTAPAGATWIWGGQYVDTASTIVSLGGFTEATTGAIGGTAANAFGSFHYVFTFTNGGTLQLQWAQNTLTAANTVLLAGTYAVLTRIS